MFKEITELSKPKELRQLYQCCDENLGDTISKEYADFLNSSEQELIRVIKQLAVIHVLLLLSTLRLT